jgi:hypothetical protein
VGDRQLQSRVRRIVAEGSVAIVALGLLAFAVLANRTWLERHFLPEFFQPRDLQILDLAIVRTVAVFLAAALLVLVRPRVGRLVERKGSRRLALDIAPSALAVVLALGTSEVLLRQLPWFATHQVPAQREPLRRRDPLLGWAYAENRTGHGRLGGRTIDYAFDAAGHRVRDRARPVDYAEPAIVWVGESIISGHGLTYDESIPARVERLTGIAAADLAVGGYATDQMYLRWRAEWPKFRQPKAVVILFMPALFHRNLEKDRPHLAPGLTWRPATDDWRLAQIVKRLVPYRSEQDIADGVAMTQGALGAMVAAARARGAVALIVVPQLTTETNEERALRARILDAARLPYIFVPVDPSWHLPRNRHPDARAAAAIAKEVADRLKAESLAGR